MMMMTSAYSTARRWLPSQMVAKMVLATPTVGELSAKFELAACGRLDSWNGERPRKLRMAQRLLTVARTQRRGVARGVFVRLRSQAWSAREERDDTGEVGFLHRRNTGVRKMNLRCRLRLISDT